MTTTSYRGRSAVGVRYLFSSRHNSAVRSRLGARGTMITTFIPRPRGGGCSSPFSIEALLCCPVASCCTRNDDNDILPQDARRWVFVTFFPSRHYSAVRSRLGARGTMITTSYRSRAAVGVRHYPCPVASHYKDILPHTLGVGCTPFFRRGTMMSGRVLVHAER
ncbi:uncharacterized protein TNCV_4587681 [Trichonephila clavipes]|uniref:Uncharacterized protein n=1 Tax=Trichonephila clavipes TaxID=2585209 RepID=A0A8X6RWJ3_TRICX|nr:uncharacterized protein TNCV_4587681 [Trichonephila clavipes]